MKPHRLLVGTVSAVTLFTALGCAYNNPTTTARQSPPPPPPAIYQQAPPLIEVAERNGFDVGKADGSRDAYDGRPYRARSTRAYYETPGYNRNLGPFQPYQNTFRNAYLQGYERGFRRG